jgi:hypothetical protein
MKINELINDFSLIGELEIKRYLPITEKQKFVMDIIDTCADDSDDFISIDRVKMRIYFDMRMIQEYANIEVASDFDDMIVQYDELCEIGLLRVLIDMFQDEYAVMKAVLEDKIHEVMVQNSIEAQVVRVANKIVGLLDVMSNIDVSKIIPSDMGVDSLLKQFNLVK